MTGFRALCVLLALASPAAAQTVPIARDGFCGAVATRLPGSLADENERALTLRQGGRWSLLRGANDDARARMSRDTTSRPVRIAAVLPELLVTSQRSFPLPANDGPMWAGKGITYSLTGGIALCGAKGRWGAIIAPTYWYAENAQFDLVTNPQIVPPLRQDYSVWASPYHYMPRSLDMPRRFGDTPVRRFETGALAFWYRNTRLEAGFTTESEWWGPGMHNALLLSSQAAGAPRVYVRTAKPLRAKGDIEIRYFLGGLSFSPYFFLVPEDSSRSLAGLVATWTPDFDKGLTVGAARLVAAPRLGNTWIKHVLDPLIPVGAPNALGRGDSTQYAGRDQLFSLFANWRLPDDGTEIWLEWARAELPLGVRDFFEAPNHTQALTIGLQHVRPLPWRDWTARVSAEYSQTNQSSSYRERAVGSWYTSRAVQGGFTQQGQVLGAAIGPGSVTQRLGLDVASRAASAGLFVSRIRWDDDSFYTIPRPLGNGLCKHDVSLAYGVRGSARAPFGIVDGSLSVQNRLNLYWQALGLCFQNEELQVDKRNISIEFRVHPRLP